MLSHHFQSPAHFDSSPAGLARVTGAGVALAVWKRPAPLADPFAEAAPIDTVVDLEAIDLALAPLGAALAADIRMLGALLADIARPATVRVRLEIVTGNACTRFHADFVRLRLLTTYAGPGTQWCPAGAMGSVRALAAGDVAIFKGRLALPDVPILHRSPPIAGKGIRRLVLALDPDPPDPA
ncbi:DUF1826 domain-containing protein [Thermaurantiacus sp.]